MSDGLDDNFTQSPLSSIGCPSHLSALGPYPVYPPYGCKLDGSFHSVFTPLWFECYAFLTSGCGSSWNYREIHRPCVSLSEHAIRSQPSFASFETY
ncbi:uncharacterized protein LAESUDRAFT_23341 [Laetiporus sulphureus 93-53]|uniref:Uncharacterized protein n=1 Tax=Laetiporus sulphureus 93-53 TaxID=1314785 RepID=A0A165IEQ2_9APHY|nr:uncharacterized protein LAESUDRAFT_23341 [Laetiporus sulphureus 93-53]KZT12973.1 hypothetical protein LAESUDRAFT_23341 [Laetiporus sulphureus 93-53]